MIRVGYVARMRDMTSAHKILVGKLEGKRRPRCRWQRNFKMYPKKAVYEGMDCNEVTRR
jgi:hypothetical protein